LRRSGAVSTRAIIAIGDRERWEGVYHHSDGYPSGLGIEIFEIAKQVGKLGVSQLLEDHPNGFSSLASGLTYKSGPMIYHNKVSSWIEWLYVVGEDRLWIKCCYCKVWTEVSYDEDVEGFKKIVEGMCPCTK